MRMATARRGWGGVIPAIPVAAAAPSTTTTTAAAVDSPVFCARSLPFSTLSATHLRWVLALYAAVMQLRGVVQVRMLVRWRGVRERRSCGGGSGWANQERRRKKKEGRD